MSDAHDGFLQFHMFYLSLNSEGTLMWHLYLCSWLANCVCVCVHVCISAITTCRSLTPVILIGTDIRGVCAKERVMHTSGYLYLFMCLHLTYLTFLDDPLPFAFIPPIYPSICPFTGAAWTREKGRPRIWQIPCSTMNGCVSFAGAMMAITLHCK